MMSHFKGLLPASVGYDENRRPPEETLSDRLLWRHVPENSGSDWTIQIVLKKRDDHSGSIGDSDADNNIINNNHNSVSPVVQTFHVHKKTLMVGPRRSGYFAQLLQSDHCFGESETNTSRIELHELAASAFPLVLDFMYSTEKDDTISFMENNVTAIYHLAKYFQMQRLQYLAKQFWQKDIPVTLKYHVYYEHAKILMEPTILQAVFQACKRNIMKIHTSKSRLVRPDYIQFWLDFESDEAAADQDGQNGSVVFMSTEQRLHLSRLMASLFNNCLNSSLVVEPHDFNTLTSPTFLPQIHCDAAILLLDAERQFLHTPNNNDGTHNHSPLSSLQKRCVESIVSHRLQMDLSEDSPNMQFLMKQSPVLMGRIISSESSAVQKAQPLLVQYLAFFKALAVILFLFASWLECSW